MATTIELRMRSLRQSFDARRFQVVGICKDEKSYVPLGQYDNLSVLYQEEIRKAVVEGNILKVKGNHKDLTAVFFATSLLKNYELMKSVEALLESNGFDADKMKVHMYKKI